jgi:hypothetical protein
MQSCAAALSENQVLITECGGTLPLLSATDGTGLAAPKYLTAIQAMSSSGPDPNTPLQIINQSNSTGGATLPTPFGSGMGGIDILQNAKAVSSNYPSPYFQMCAQQLLGMGTPVSAPGCWQLRVDAGSGANPQDVIEWTRLATTNQTHNITMLWPAQINIASRGQITVGPEPLLTGASANTPSTFTGQTNLSTAAGLGAGFITIEPGQLQAGTGADGSIEGSLQILQGYIVSNVSVTDGRLACPTGATGASQVVQPCTNTGAAENWVGVFNSSIPGQLALQPPPNTGVTLTPVRYGRVPILSAGTTGVTFHNGDFVCKDDANASYVVNSANACPVGESIGIAVGDTASPATTSHLVDLVPQASALLQSYWTNGPTAGSVTIATSGTQYIYGLIIPAQVMAGHIVLDVATADTTPTNLYSVGIYAVTNSTTLCMTFTPPCVVLVAHISPQAFTTTGVQAPIAFQEGTVAFPTGKYYLGLTGEATALKLASIVTTLIPLPATSEGPTTLGAQITGPFTPPADSWVAAGGSEPVIALAP